MDAARRRGGDARRLSGHEVTDPGGEMSSKGIRLTAADAGKYRGFSQLQWAQITAGMRLNATYEGNCSGRRHLRGAAGCSEPDGGGIRC